MTRSQSSDGHLADGLVHGDAGVVDQDVELAVGVEDFADDPLAVFGRADVALVDAGAGVGLAEVVGGVLAARVARRDRDAAGGEPVADRQPDTAHAAGDQRNLSGHVCHLPSFRRWLSGGHADRRERSPWPPPPHRPAAPSPPPRRPSSSARCRAMRAPDAPTGWPMAIAPPLTLTSSSPMSEVAHRLDGDRGERLVDLEQVDVVRRQALPCRAP